MVFCFLVLQFWIVSPFFSRALSVGIPSNMELGSRGCSSKEVLCLFLLHVARCCQPRITFNVNFLTLGF